MSTDKRQDFAETLTSNAPGDSGVLNVLVVDDSAIVRQVLGSVLSEKRGFCVNVAADPFIAMEKMKKFPPDVILLDLEMPRMDGLTFLEKVMSQNPVPVVICSELTGPRTEAAIRALEIGAVDIITKPKVGIRGFLEESADGDKVVPGRAYIAPGNRHTLVRRLGPSYFLEVRDGSLVSRHRPSVNVLFRSVAQAAGASAVGVLMTGMGDDGADGLLEMKQAEALTIAQDEASCVVFGMPREAILRGAVNEVLSLSQIPAAILRNTSARKS